MPRGRKPGSKNKNKSVVAKTKTRRELIALPSNWGAKELPRACPKCKSQTSKITGKYPVASRLIRYRACEECGQRFTTNEANE